MVKKNKILNIIKNILIIIFSIIISFFVMKNRELSTFTRIMLFFLTYVFVGLILEQIFKLLKKR